MPYTDAYRSRKFTSGTRVLLLKGRHKDGNHDQRQITRVTHDEEQWHRHFDELVDMSVSGERIYGTASERCIKKAARLFQERQLAASYDDDPMLFYRHLHARWASCLMKPTSQKDKVWMFDCDDAYELKAVRKDIKRLGLEAFEYGSKSGIHIVVKPFNRTLLLDQSRKVLQENPLLLLAY
jgi:hypothetical protein